VLSCDIFHIKKFGYVDVDVVLKSLFLRVGERSNDIYNRLDPEVMIRNTISNLPMCIDSTLYHFVLVAYLCACVLFS
jgi:hypothetical protein